MNERATSTVSIPPWISHGLSELIGTFVMMTVGITGIIVAFGTNLLVPFLPHPGDRVWFCGFLFAAIVAIIIYSPIGRISGAHLNPAVTLTFFLERQLPGRDTLVYIAMQVLGSAAAAALCHTLWGERAVMAKFGATLPGPGYSTIEAFAVEVLATFILLRTICFFLHTPSLTRFTGIAVGLAIFLLVGTFGPISGASLNPARSLGPVLVGAPAASLWAYLSGPITATGLAVAAHHLIPLLKRPIFHRLNPQH